MTAFLEEKIGAYTIVPAPVPTNPDAVGIRLPDGTMFGYSAPKTIIDRVDPHGNVVASHVDPGRPCKAFTLETGRDTVRQMIESDEKQDAKAKAKAMAAAAIDAAGAAAPAADALAAKDAEIAKLKADLAKAQTAPAPAPEPAPADKPAKSH